MLHRIQNLKGALCWYMVVITILTLYRRRWAPGEGAPAAAAWLSTLVHGAQRLWEEHCRLSCGADAAGPGQAHKSHRWGQFAARPQQWSRYEPAIPAVLLIWQFFPRFHNPVPEAPSMAQG